MESRNILVTGASRGIGAAIAQAFALEGNQVAIHFSASANEARTVYEGLPGNGHLLVQGDLRDDEAPHRILHEIGQQWSHVDVLVNNAGVVHRVPVDSEDVAEWQQAWQDTLQVNLLAPAVLVWHIVRVMPAGGRIINMSSRAAFRGMPDSVMYAASKAGLAAMTQSLALALGPRGISVTALAPGYADTDMGRLVLDGPDSAAIRAQSPFNRVATTDEIAKAVLYLADPDSEWVAGSVLDCNGASHLRL